MDPNALNHKLAQKKQRALQHEAIATIVDLALEAIAERVQLLSATDAFTRWRPARDKLVAMIQNIHDEDHGYEPDNPAKPAAV